jgi:hypothetical protein
MGPVKKEARQLIDQLRDDATWDDLMYEIYVKQKVAAAQQAAAAGRVIAHQEVRKRMAKR